MSRIDGKRALVTGAANGIGAGTARVLAEAGAEVFLADIAAVEGEALANELRGAGHAAQFIQLDVSQEDQWARAIDQVGELDVLVNNAGIVIVSSIEQMSLEELQKITSINLHGVFLGMKHAVPAMKARAKARQAGGSIINVSSVVGMKAYPFGAAYSMTKGGVRILTKSAAIEFAMLKYNIRVNSIHPGLIETPMLVQETVEHAQLGSLADSEEAMREAFVEMTPLGRLGEPEEIAKGILFLASDDSSFMTGSELVIDGGDTAS
jgi:NAD(P)-dependent dehydrogenase (short-subunit alcohol dehydrogenase family)